MARLTNCQQVMQQMMMPIVFMPPVITVKSGAAKRFCLRGIFHTLIYSKPGGQNEP